MPHDKIAIHQLPLSAEDKVFVLLHTRSRSRATAEVVRFCVEYKALIEGRWRKVVRYDSTHGIPHRHTFDWYGESGRTIEGSREESSMIFNAALRRIKDNHLEMRAAFIATK